MPTVLTHAAVPLALGLGLGPRAVPTRLLVAGAVASALPDLDVIGYRLGVPYAAALGHRGLTHSLAFAVLSGLLAAAAARPLRVGRWTAFLFVAGATASHGLLDTLTSGGLGVALLWPFTAERFFAPFRPIRVAPISLGRMLGPQGLAVLASEARWVWLPAVALALALRWGRGLRARRTPKLTPPV